jgi:putative addiction module killer protein
LLKIRDKTIRIRILARLLRVENGNYGDYKSLKDGVFELRFTYGAGFRVYFGEDGDKIVVLLCGGDKSTQTEDIEKAKVYWRNYFNHEKI